MTESNPLTLKVFQSTVERFTSRHKQIRSIERDVYFPEKGLQYVGEIKGGYSFMMRYTPEDEAVAECVSLAIVMRIQETDIDMEWLARITKKMHHDYPGTDDLEFFYLSTEDGNLVLLGSELIFAREPTDRDLDARFDLLCREAPNVGTQFFNRHRVT